jgi:hypothetical protein
LGEHRVTDERDGVFDIHETVRVGEEGAKNGARPLGPDQLDGCVKADTNSVHLNLFQTNSSGSLSFS